MTFAKIADVKAGDTLIADGGFTCLKAGPVVVEQDDGGKFIPCSDGRHYLAGQADGGRYVGLSLPEAK